MARIRPCRNRIQQGLRRLGKEDKEMTDELLRKRARALLDEGMRKYIESVGPPFAIWVGEAAEQ